MPCREEIREDFARRVGDSPRVIVNRLTCQRALRNRRERQGDSPRVIANRLTCQRALCNRRKRQGGSQRVTVTDLVHGSSTTVQNRVQCKENSTRSNENLSISKLINTAINVKLLKSKVTFNARENVKVTHQTEGDLGNESKVNETCYSETCHNSSTEKINKTLPHYQISTTHMRVYSERTITFTINSSI